ncbi:MAG: hypothetical protein KBC81_01700 [Candidatus Pacebacteria bacterium]|nr:hypothetical protein [Candidatus Paceibacterota bacterium]
MRPTDVKTFRHKDKLASKRRHRFQIKTISIVVGAVIVIAGMVYALFYAPWFQIDVVNYQGLSDSNKDEIQRVVDDALGHRLLGLPISRDVFFFGASSLAANLSSQFSFLDGVRVEKDYLHTINIIGNERKAEGVWCFDSTSSVPDCKYYDRDGITFGQAIQSSGVLLLNVDDMRIKTASTSLSLVDSKFLKTIQEVVPALNGQNVLVKKITIPVDTYTEFDVLVGDGYVVKFSLDSDIPGQIDVFRIFRAQKMVDGSLKPQYVDLRFDGRVYFK